MANPQSRSGTPSPAVLDKNPESDAPAREEAPATEGLSEIKKLTSTVKASFDELLKTNAEQSKGLMSALEKMGTAVEILKNLKQPQASDKKTTFWTAYKTLADEFDQEFQKKHGADLDTGLIFAGLFSAVSSAFIIQIQPELQPDPNASMQALLTILVQNVTGTPVPVSISTQTGPAAIVVVAQSLLYFSLFSTLLAALLAVLAKQWLLHYDSVGERGTIEERGLERQRKFDGLQHWKFDLVMQIFPLLLQFALLLFAAALSLYLWTIHHVIAAIVLGLTCLGVVLYSLMVVSALVSPDSPFQTSLTSLLEVVLKMIPQSFCNSIAELRRLVRKGIDPLRSLLPRISSVCSGLLETIPPLLPLFNNNASESTSLQPSRIFNDHDIPPPSQAIPAILWALETSTDPLLVEAAAALVPDLQWPVNLDLRPSLKRLDDIFIRCLYNGNRVREGMSGRATSCITAFGILEMVTERLEGWSELWTFPEPYIFAAEPELTSMVRFFRVSHLDNIFVPHIPPLLITQQCIRFISTQTLPGGKMATFLRNFKPNKDQLKDKSVLGDFLFCMNSVFMRPHARDLSLMDKSRHCPLLLALLFENLAKSFTGDGESLDVVIVNKIIRKILEFNNHLRGFSHYSRCMTAVYRFCAIPGLELPTLESALQLMRLDPFRNRELDRLMKSEIDTTGDIAWVYSTLEVYDSQLMDSALVGDLLQVLHLSLVPSKPTTKSFRAILRAISPGVDNRATKLWAFFVLCALNLHWFEDSDLGPVLQEHSQSVWNLLMTFRHQNLRAFISMGDTLSQIPEWKATLSQDLAGWLDNLPTLLNMEFGLRQQFCAVLSRVWSTDAAEGEQFGDEKPFVMAYTVLADTWDVFDFTNLQEIQLRLSRLIRCTVSTAFSVRQVLVKGQQGSAFYEVANPSQGFKDIIMTRLGEAVARAFEQSKAATLGDALLRAHTTNILAKLVWTINGNLKDGPPQGEEKIAEGGEMLYWEELKIRFNDDIDALEKLFRETSTTAAISSGIESLE